MHRAQRLETFSSQPEGGDGAGQPILVAGRLGGLSKIEREAASASVVSQSEDRPGTSNNSSTDLVGMLEQRLLAMEDRIATLNARNSDSFTTTTTTPQEAPPTYSRD